MLRNIAVMVSLVIVSGLCLGAELKIVVVTGGAKHDFIFRITLSEGEHLNYGIQQWYGARLYFYKAMLEYRSRFRRFLEEPLRAEVSVVELDNEPEELNLDGVRLLILDDVSAYAIEAFEEQIVDYVEDGGVLLVVAGSYGLGGWMPVKGVEPAIERELVMDPMPQNLKERMKKDPYLLWYAKRTYRESALSRVLPVEIISTPDLVVHGRAGAGPGLKAKPPKVEGGGRLFDGVPIEEWQIYGYHRVRVKTGADVLARIDEGSPLLVIGKYGKGRVVVFTGAELEGAVRLNGPNIHYRFINERGLPWKWSDIFWLRLARLALGRKQIGMRMAVAERVSITEGAEMEVTVAELPERIRRLGFELVVRKKDGNERSRVTLNVPASFVSDKSFRFRFSPRGLVPGKYDLVGSLKVERGTYRSQVLDRSVAYTEVVGEVEAEWEGPESLVQGERGKFSLKLKGLSEGSDVSVRLIDPQGEIVAERMFGARKKILVSLRANLLPGRYFLQAYVQKARKVVGGAEKEIWVAVFREPRVFICIPPLTEQTARDLKEHLIDGVYLHFVSEPGLSLCDRYGIYYMASPNIMSFPRWRMRKEERAWWRDHTGKPTANAWGLNVCPNHKVNRKLIQETLKRWLTKWEKHPSLRYIFADDEPQFPPDSCYAEECVRLFRERSGIDAVKPEARFDKDYLERWARWEEFRGFAFKRYHELVREVMRSVNPEIKLTSALGSMDLPWWGTIAYYQQAPLDVLWIHFYPWNEPMAIIPLELDKLDSTARALGVTGRKKWFLGQTYNDCSRVPRTAPPEYAREQFWLALSRGVSAVGYWSYSQGFWILPGTDTWEEIKEVGLIMRHWGPTVERLRAVRKPVAVLYSFSQGCLDALRGLTWKSPLAPVVPWKWWHRVEAVYTALGLAGFSPEVITEYDLLKNGIPARVLVLPGIEFLKKDTRLVIEKYISEGGKVIADTGTMVEIKGIKRLDIDVDCIFNDTFPEDPELWNTRKHRDIYLEELLPMANTLRREIYPLVKGALDIEVEGKRVLWNVLNGGAVRYLFLVNDNCHSENPEKYAKFLKRWRLIPTKWEETTAKVKVKSRERIRDIYSGEWRESPFEVSLPPATGRIIALFRNEFGRLKLTCDSEVSRGAKLKYRVDARGRDRAFRGVLPLRVTLKGTSLEVFTATDEVGVCRGELLLPSTLTSGKRTLMVEELLTGKRAKKSVKIEAGAPVIAPDGG